MPRRPSVQSILGLLSRGHHRRLLRIPRYWREDLLRGVLHATDEIAYQGDTRSAREMAAFTPHFARQVVSTSSSKGPLVELAYACKATLARADDDPADAAHLIGRSLDLLRQSKVTSNHDVAEIHRRAASLYVEEDLDRARRHLDTASAILDRTPSPSRRHLLDQLLVRAVVESIPLDRVVDALESLPKRLALCRYFLALTGTLHRLFASQAVPLGVADRLRRIVQLLPASSSARWRRIHGHLFWLTCQALRSAGVSRHRLTLLRRSRSKLSPGTLEHTLVSIDALQMLLAPGAPSHPRLDPEELLRELRELSMSTSLPAELATFSPDMTPQDFAPLRAAWIRRAPRDHWPYHLPY